ncbi:hypothetical protein [Demequina sp.]|uniref:hypothetical protein n=1 Tax=Demequina sp. TaxID=2050685 RepID=UPI003A8726F9
MGDWRAAMEGGDGSTPGMRALAWATALAGLLVAGAVLWFFTVGANYTTPDGSPTMAGLGVGAGLAAAAVLSGLAIARGVRAGKQWAVATASVALAMVGLGTLMWVVLVMIAP